MKPAVKPVLSAVTVDVDGRACVYSPTRNEVLFLNQSASDIWWLLESTLDVPGLVDALAHAYGVDPEVLAADVHQALAVFADAGLIDPGAPA